MRLIAFRSEYQLTVEPARNRIFYKHYAEQANGCPLPDFLDDWQQALEALQPGFTILSDLTALPTVSNHLSRLIVRAQQLVLGHGVRLVAAVHAPDSETYYASQALGQESVLPIRTFTDLWEADKFLDELVAETAF